MNVVNYDLVGTLCDGYSAYLEYPHAAFWAVKDYLTVVETLGWTKPFWREKYTQVASELLLGRSSPGASEVNSTEKPKQAVIALDRDALYERWKQTHGLR